MTIFIPLPPQAASAHPNGFEHCCLLLPTLLLTNLLHFRSPLTPIRVLSLPFLHTLDPPSNPASPFLLHSTPQQTPQPEPTLPHSTIRSPPQMRCMKRDTAIAVLRVLCMCVTIGVSLPRYIPNYHGQSFFCFFAYLTNWSNTCLTILSFCLVSTKFQIKYNVMQFAITLSLFVFSAWLLIVVPMQVRCEGALAISRHPSSPYAIVSKLNPSSSLLFSGQSR